MTCEMVHKVWTPSPRKPLGVQTLCILLMLLGATSAHADCPSAPISSPNDLVVSFLAAHGTQAAPSSLLSSSVKEGMLVYDASADELKVCNGTSWVSVGSDAGSATAAGTTSEVQFRDIATGDLAANANFVWDNANARLGIGIATPTQRLDVDGGFRLKGSSGSRFWSERSDSEFDFLIPSGSTKRALSIHAASTSGNLIEAYGHDGTSFVPSLSVTNGASVGIGTTAPAASAALEVVSIGKGFLPPRMSEAQRDAIAAPATGLMIFNVTAGQYQFWTGSTWSALGGTGIPVGTIAAFALTTCPTGWSEYVAARGRFLRGIDNGAGNDPSGTRAPGNTQADAFQGHAHNYNIPNAGGWTWTLDYAGNAGNYPAVTGSIVSDGSSGTPRTSNETRPKNVAVLFCQYSGAGGGGGGGSASAAGAASEVQFRDSSTGAFAANANFVWDDANARLGVGTDTPGNTVAIVGKAGETSVLRLTGNNPASRIRIGNATAASTANESGLDLAVMSSTQERTAARLYAGFSDTIDATRTAFLNFSVQENGAQTFPLTLAGSNVGIGTSTPQGKLDLYGSQITRGDLLGYGYFQPKYGTPVFGTDFDRFEIKVDPSSQVTYLGNIHGGTGSARALALTAGGTERLRIGTNGNVGIGTISPQAKLHIDTGGFGEAIRLYNGYSIGTRGGGGPYLSGGAYVFIMGAGGDIGAQFSPGYAGAPALTLTPLAGQDGILVNTAKFVVKVDGKVGIGTTAPVSPLHVASAGSLDVTIGTEGDAAGEQAILNFVTKGQGPIAAVNTKGWHIAARGDAWGSGEANDLQFMSYAGTSGTSVLALSDSGNVGIGTSTPNDRFVVTSPSVADTKIEVSANGDNYAALRIKNNLQSYIWQVTPSGDAPAGRLRLFKEAPSAVEIVTALSNGNVGMGTSLPGARLDVRGSTSSVDGVKAFAGTAAGVGVQGLAQNGSVYGMLGYNNAWGVVCNGTNCGGNQAWTNYSDARLKKNIRALTDDDGLSAIMKLRPVRFRWKDVDQDRARGEQLGLIAQEVEETLPEILGAPIESTITTDDGMKRTIPDTLNVSYATLVVPLIKAVQELKVLSDAQAAEIERLKADLNALPSRPDDDGAALPEIRTNKEYFFGFL